MLRGVRIVHLSPEALRALADGDHERARALAPVPLTGFVLTDPRCVATWRMRAEQVAVTPGDLLWVTGLLVDEAVGVVGQGGFHGAPDAAGMVEIGYKVDPALRRRGHGRATVAALLARALSEPAVRVVRASISPTNEASLGLIAHFPFERVGEQVDEVDGLEWVFETSL